MTTDWPVETDYTISGDWLIPSGQARSTYTLIDAVITGNGPGEFAKLRRGDEGSLLRFVRTWGLLGHQQIGSGFDYAKFSEQPGVRRDGEPLDWIWGHSENVRTVLELSERISNGREERVSSYLEEVFRRGEGQGLLDEDGRVTGGLMFYRLAANAPVLHPLLRTDQLSAEEVVAIILNFNLTQTMHQIRTAPLRLEPQVPSLLQAIYWHLARIVTSERPDRRLTRCEECGNLFEVRDERQRFCPPPSHQLGTTGSVCGARNRKRRVRQRKRDGQR